MKHLILLLNLSLCVHMVYAQWETVGNPGFSDGTAYNITIQTDSGGTVYACYADAANDSKATVMKFNGLAWEAVGQKGFTPGIALSPVLAIHPDGTPYVAFADQPLGQLLSVMKFDGNNWVYVGSAGFSPSLLSLCDFTISPNGTPYVAFGDFSKGNRISVMKFDGSSWAMIGDPGFSSFDAGYSQIAVSTDEIPYAAYLNTPFFTLSVKKFDGIAWVSVGDSSFVQNGTTPQLLLDQNDMPYLAYLEGLGTISVQKYTGAGNTGWEIVGTPSFVSGIPSYLSFALSENGTPYVGYTDQLSFFKNYVKKFDGAAWVNVGVNPVSPDTTAWSAITVSSEEIVYLAFQDYTVDQKITVMKFNDETGIFAPGMHHESLKLFPNPSAEWIELDQEFITKAGTLIITDEEGRVVLKEPFKGNPKLDIHHLLPGYYQLQLVAPSENKIYTASFVKISARN